MNAHPPRPARSSTRIVVGHDQLDKKTFVGACEGVDKARGVVGEGNPRLEQHTGREARYGGRGGWAARGQIQALFGEP